MQARPRLIALLLLVSLALQTAQACYFAREAHLHKKWEDDELERQGRGRGE